MYVKYKISSLGWSASEILSDISGLLTGTITSVTQLSASADQSFSYLLNETAELAPSGWTVHDANAGVNKLVFKHEQYDKPGSYNYLIITLTTGSVNYLRIQTADYWDEVGHVGTNVTTNADKVNLYNELLRFFITPRTFVMSSRTAASSTVSYVEGYFEHLRVQVWDTLTAGYSNAFVIPFHKTAPSATKTSAFAPRIQSSNGTDLIGFNLSSLHGNLDLVTGSGREYTATTTNELKQTVNEIGTDVTVLDTLGISGQSGVAAGTDGNYFYTDISETNELYCSVYAIYEEGTIADLGADGKYICLTKHVGASTLRASLWVRL